MKIENTMVSGFEPAFRGMRNPKNSWDLSDTLFNNYSLEESLLASWGKMTLKCPEMPIIGTNDLQLALNLIRGGTEHRKFLRMINVWADLTLSRAVWTEFDTYKIGVTRNSCSTMHKLGSKELTLDDFEDGQENAPYLSIVLEWLNEFAVKMKENKTFEYRRKMKMLLPESFLQKATVCLNYEVLLSMYFQRRNHRMKEWRQSAPGSICHWIENLPYMDSFIEAAIKEETV